MTAMNLDTAYYSIGKLLDMVEMFKRSGATVGEVIIEVDFKTWSTLYGARHPLLVPSDDQRRERRGDPPDLRFGGLITLRCTRNFVQPRYRYEP